MDDDTLRASTGIFTIIACVVVPGIKLDDMEELGQRFDDNERA